MDETQNESDGVKPLAQVIHIDEERTPHVTVVAVPIDL